MSSASDFGAFVGTWVRFFVITVASAQISLLSPRVGLPLITGYMFFGLLAGPQILSLVETTDLPRLQYITQIALAFISLSAGAELYLPELRSLFKRIIWITGSITVITFVTCTLVIYGLSAGDLVPFMYDLNNPSCSISISLIMAAIMVSQSPSSAIAVVRELAAKGPFTSTMLGVTVLIDVLVLLLYSIASSIANAQCDPLANGFQVLDLVLTVVCITFAIVIGYIVGKFIIFLIWIPRIQGEYLVLPLGFGIFQFSAWFLSWTTNNIGHGINFDPLLICIAAGYIVANHSRNRRKFLKFLGVVGPLIFIPFFTLTGASLQLTTLGAALPFAILVFITRAGCFAGGVAVGGIYSRDNMPMAHIKVMWLAMVTQAGVSLGIAAEVAIAFSSSWGAQFQSTVISVILLNQVVGPIISKFAIKRVGEANQAHGEDEEEEHRIKKALIMGCTPTAVALTQRLLHADWDVVILDLDDTKFEALNHLKVPVRRKKSHEGHESNVKTDAAHQSVADAANEGAREAAEAMGGETVSEALAREAREAREAEESERSPQPQESASEDDVAPPTSFPSTPHGSTFITFADDANRRVIHRLITPIRLEHTSGSSNFRVSDEEKALKLGVEVELVDCTAANTDVAIVQFDTDAKTFAICNYLLDSLHLTRVIALVHNPNWASMFTSIGVLSIFPFSTTTSLIFKACTNPAKAHLDLLDASVPLHVALAQLIQPDSMSRIPFHLSDASSREQAEFLESHPNPPLPAAELWKFDFKMKVVSAAARDEYVNQIYGVHASKGTFKMSTREAVNQAAVTFTGPSLLNDRDEEEEKEAEDDDYKNPHHEEL